MTRPRIGMLAGTVLLATACGTTVPQGAAGQLNGAAALGGAAGRAPSAGSAGLDAGVDGGTPLGAAGATAPGGGPPGGGTLADAGPAGGAAGAPGAAGGTSSTGAVPGTRGPGFDADNVYVGVTQQKDVSRAATSLGLSLDPGDQEGDVEAVIADINARGGLLGRKIIPVYRDHQTAAMQADPNGVGQATCTYFTQDRPVIAVINPVSLLDTDTFRTCLIKKSVFLFSLSVQVVEDTTFRKLGPYFITSVVPSYSRLAPVLISRLKAQGYFGGWSTANGAAGPDPVKVGALVKDNSDGDLVAKALSAAVRAEGLGTLEVFRYKQSNDYSSAVLRFRADGVTHVLPTDSSAVQFLIQADAQGYRPRYGLSSYTAPQTLLQTTAPPQQLVGAQGVGFGPPLDVDQQRQPPGAQPGEPKCVELLKKRNLDYEGRRFAQAVAYAICDGFWLLELGAARGGGLNAPSLSAGIDTIGARFATAFGFRSGLGRGTRAVPGGARDLQWLPSCSCFRYASGTYPL